MANEGEEDLDDVRSVISSASVSSRQSVASVKAMERRAHLAALKQQIRFAVQESEVRAAQQAAEHKLKQLELAKQVAMAEAELAVYANVEVESDPEVTFPKLRQQPSSPALRQVQQDDVAVKQPIADIQVCNSLVDQSPPEGLLVSSSCNTEVGSHSNVIKYLCESISRFQLPKLELTVFKGDPLEFQEWKMSFVKLVEDVTPEPSHRLHYLMQYTSGEAHTLVTAYSLDPSLSGYNNAMKELSKEFGDPYILARAYLRKIEGWPHIKMGDTPGLRSFLAFLKKCRGSMTTLRHLNQLNTDLYLQKIIVKLPIAVQASWRKRVSCLEEQGVDATFQEVVEFIDKQARIAKHPVFSTDALLEAEGKSKVVVSNIINSVSPKRKAVYVTTTESSSDGDGASSQATVAAQVVSAPRRIVPACPMCTGSHDLDDCQQYLQQTVDDRHKFLVSRKLCFSCYGQSSRNHTARSCRRRRTCATCGKQHPTGLHGYKPAHRQTGDSRPVDTTEAIAVPDSVGTCATHVQSDTVAMSIVMVRVCHEYHEVIVYAALDSMSSACFVTSDVCRQLGIDGEKTEITIKL